MQFHQLKRREFITLFGGAAVAWAFVARAQQPAMPVVGFLHYASPATLEHLAAAVRGGLKEAGYIEGQNVAIEYRWAEGHYDRLPAMAADLVRRQVTVITAGGAVAAEAAKRATAAVPIVFTSGADPVASGLVRSLSRPGGNLTGVSLLTAEMATKRLELIRDLLPHARAVAMIVNPTFPGAEAEMAEVEAAGRTIGMQTYGVKATSPSDIDAALASFGQLHVDAFMVGADGFFITRRDQFAALARRYAIPGIYPFPDFPEAGGLLSYGVSLADAYRQAGVLTGRILKGAKPAELPVMQPTKFEFVLNLKTAKALGLDLPPTVLSRADGVIE
jgi:putative ABC transport system substrate-binding protein